MKITAAQAIDDALNRYKTQRADAKQPSRVLLGQRDYEILHEAAKAEGMDCPLYPQNEDARLEYKGMKVCCHNSNDIRFE